MSLRTYSVYRDVKAGCFDCNNSDAKWHGPNAQGVAARHHDATGHITWVDVYMSITYGSTRTEARKKEAAKDKNHAEKEQ